MFDVAIIGRGPAGAIAALSLAQRGLKVVMLEKERLPRYKTCGGGLVERGLKLLPADVGGAVQQRHRSAELHFLDDALHLTAERAVPIGSMTMPAQLHFPLAAPAPSAAAEVRSRPRVSGRSLGNSHA